MWDSGFQHYTFIQSKKKDKSTSKIGRVMNMCPIHNLFKDSWNTFSFTYCKYSDNKKHPVPSCDCQSDNNITFFQLMRKKSYTCIYHYAAYHYLLLMYGDPSSWEICTPMKCTNDSDEIEVVKIIPPRQSECEDKKAKLRNEGTRKLLNTPIPKKGTINTPTSSTKGKGRTLGERGRVRYTYNNNIGKSTKSPPNKRNSRPKAKDVTPLKTPVRSPKSRVKRAPLPTFPKAVVRSVYNHSHWKGKDYEHLY